MTKQAQPLAPRRRLSSAALTAVAALALSGTAVAVIPMGSGGEGSGLKPTGPGRVLVIDANLKMAFREAHVQDTDRARLFVRRLLSDLREKEGHRPDVLLLQEVVKRTQSGPSGGPRSASAVANALSSSTGDPYRVVIAAGSVASPAGTNDSRETAIVANLETMRPPSVKGLVKTPCPRDNRWCRRARRQGRDSRTRHHAYAVIEERGRGGRRFPVATVHLLTTRKNFGCPDQTGPCARGVARLKADWTRRIADRLKGASGGSWSRAVIAGDFNNTRSDPFYDVLGRRGFRDSLRGVSGAPPIDFIFTRRRLFEAGFDRRSGGEGKSFPYGYSDHRFLWARVGDP